MSASYFSRVPHTLLKKRLLQAQAPAFLAIGVLFILNSFEKDQLQDFGLLFFTLALGLLGLAYLPYLRLKKLALQPYQITARPSGFELKKAGRVIFTERWDAIDKLVYQEEEGKQTFGLEIHHQNKPYFIAFIPKKDAQELIEIWQIEKEATND